MESLSRELLSVLATLPSYIPPELRVKYELIVHKHTKSLDKISSSTENAHTPAEIVYQSGKILFGNRCIGQSSPLYQKQQQKYWSQTCWLPAACFLALENAVEVALAMKLIACLNCPFSIRSAGHNANPGFSSIDERGVVLDVSSLDQVYLSNDRRIVSVGPGAIWGDVYERLENCNLTVAGGRVADVGVGGLIAGGGMSHFSNYWGFACDGVKNFEVVTGESRIVYANADENPDLYQVLKGMGSNFGIVTRFDVETHPDCHIWWGIQKFATMNMTSVIEATINIQKAMEEDSKIGYFLTIYPDSCVAGLLYKGEPPPGDPFREFDSIEPKEILVPKSPATYCSSARALSMSTPMRREIGTVATRINAQFYAECHRILQIISTESKLAEKCISLYFSLQPIGITAVQKGDAHGGNMLSLFPENQTWLAIVAEWKDEENDGIARSAIRSFINSVQTAADSRGLLLDTCFMNDASFFQLPWQGFGGESIDQLVEASETWDHDCIFQRLQNSGFLLKDRHVVKSRLHLDRAKDVSRA